jgi:hypothetical protein
MKLRRIDKWCAAIAIGLFLAMWGYRYFPLQRCEVHGEWLKRRQVLLSFGTPDESMTYYQAEVRVRYGSFPYPGDYPRFSYPTEKIKIGGLRFIRHCKQCRQAQQQWSANYQIK